MKAEPEMDIHFYRAGWILAGIILLYFAVSQWFHFDAALHLPRCVFHSLTGFYCIGCGGGRAMSALAHGKILQAMYYNAFYPYAMLVGGWFMISQTIQRISKGRLQIGLHYRNIYLFIGLGILVVNFLIKNFLLLKGIHM